MYFLSIHASHSHMHILLQVNRMAAIDPIHNANNILMTLSLKSIIIFICIIAFVQGGCIASVRKKKFEKQNFILNSFKLVK